MLRVAVTCGLYGWGVRTIVDKDEFVSTLFTKFVLAQERCIESRAHLDICDVAYDAYLMHHAHTKKSQQYGLVRALFDGDDTRAIVIMATINKELKAETKEKKAVKPENAAQRHASLAANSY